MISIFFTSLYLKNTVYLYSISLNVTDARQDDNSYGSSGVGLSNRLAQAVGVKISNPVPKLFSIYKSILKSRHISDEIWINNPDLVRKIFHKGWDDNNNTWYIAEANTQFLIKNYIKSFLGLPLSELKSVSSADLHRLIMGSLSIGSNSDDTITKLTIYSDRPDLKKELLIVLNQTANDLLKKRVVDRSNKNILFLLDQISKTSNRDHKASLVATLNDQQKTRMMVSSNLPYIAEPIGNVEISENPVKPNGKIILVLSTFISLFFSILIIITLDKIKTNS